MFVVPLLISATLLACGGTACSYNKFMEKAREAKSQTSPYKSVEAKYYRKSDTEKVEKLFTFKADSSGMFIYDQEISVEDTLIISTLLHFVNYDITAIKYDESHSYFYNPLKLQFTSLDTETIGGNEYTIYSKEVYVFNHYGFMESVKEEDKLTATSGESTTAKKVNTELTYNYKE